MFKMQVMPSTARNPGYGVAPAKNDTADEYNRVGRDYRAAMQSHYGGDLAKMWAAYNWGPGHLDNAISQHGDDWQQYAPPETQKYLKRNFGMFGRR